MLPLENWGFKRYGITRAISLEDNYEDKSPFGNSKGTFEWLMGKDYNNTEALDSVIKAFTAVASNRDELYVLDTSSDGTVNPNNKVHATQNGAQKELNEMNEELANQKLTNYCQTSIKKTAFVKSVDVTYCPAFLMQVLANMASKNGPTLGFDVKGKYATVKTKFVKAFALGIKDPHFQESYYLLAYNNFK